ncbi:Haloacid dehalogenase-like hydrolase superfamily protein isoform 3, partial [Theobroma cacao]
VRKLPGDIHSHTNQTRQISPPQLKNQNSPLYTNHSSQAMASHSTLLFSPPNLSPKFSSLFHYSLQSLTFQTKKPSSLSLTNTRKRRQLSVSVVSASHSLQALILDCDGVILESEHLHRQAYNDAFSHFNVRCPPSSQPLNWVPEFYDVLQNRIGGGKPKMRGDDVKEKKPDPSIYLTAAKRLGVSEKDCLVVEDSVIGLQAATKAGMACVITYTSSTADQDFKGSIAIYPDLSNVRLSDLELLLQNVAAAN